MVRCVFIYLWPSNIVYHSVLYISRANMASLSYRSIYAGFSIIGPNICLFKTEITLYFYKSVLVLGVYYNDNSPVLLLSFYDVDSFISIIIFSYRQVPIVYGKSKKCHMSSKIDLIFFFKAIKIKTSLYTINTLGNK